MALNYFFYLAQISEKITLSPLYIFAMSNPISSNVNSPHGTSSQEGELLAQLEDIRVERNILDRRYYKTGETDDARYKELAMDEEEILDQLDEIGWSVEAEEESDDEEETPNYLPLPTESCALAQNTIDDAFAGLASENLAWNLVNPREQR